MLAERSRHSLADFYRYVFRYSTPPHIALVVEALQALDDGLFDRLLIVEPPGHAKSTVVSIAYPTWHIGRFAADSIIGATTTGTLAELYIDSIAEVIERDSRYERTFPHVKPDRKRGWSKNGLFVTRPYRPGQKDPTIALVGAGGPIIGRRADLMLIDDAVDEPVARSSEVKLPARVEWVKRSVRSRLKPGGKLVIAGTVWAEDDVIESFRELGTFVTIVMRALSDSRDVFAEVQVPDDVDWKPLGALEVEAEPEKSVRIVSA